MNVDITLRYILEFSMIIPAVIFAVIPLTEYLRFNSMRSFFVALFLMSGSIFAGAFLSTRYELKIRTLLIPVTVIFFVLYFVTIDASVGKKLFCFFNSLMICELCPMFTILLTPYYEIANLMWHTHRLFTVQSGLLCLGFSILAGGIFFSTLTKKLPMLLHEERINAIWDFLFLVPFAMAIFLYWSRPVNPVVVITGRVRQITIVLMIFITTVILLFYHIFWWTAKKFKESARLQQENNLLQMEGKRYNELRNYMEKTRTLRHDFRQHILVISELLKSERFNELENYISQFNDQTVTGYSNYCANNAVDAIASYYDGIASSQDTKISWGLALPSSLPIKDSDYCAMIGNLLENSLRAVKNLPHDKRKIKISSSMLSDVMLGISIDNPFTGEISFAKNGLPVSKHEGHGIGLISVLNTVERYGGNLNIKTENKIFSVDIILYSSNINTEC